MSPSSAGSEVMKRTPVLIDVNGVPLRESPVSYTHLDVYKRQLRERLITMQKQLEGTQKYINEQCR